MKTKILKIGMPLMAFLLAIAFAFATNEKPQTENVLVTGYIYSSKGCIETPHDCTVEGNTTCKLGTQEVFRTKSGTQCDNPLMRW